ncbi:hypothetical protein HQN90_27450 [Paenibacillus alba]|uniref:hypothetical protein n=1 Tax=Paenibacillus alba TaxID=1197127 RepID=UPI001563B1DD|nr:hypothetical protein [Paenibacillus alba]NQX69874.1 hypothetical protein [Paenibacillus alba]
MKYKKNITIILGALIIGAGWYSYADGKTRTATLDASQVSYSTLNELEESSKLIVSGVPLKQENHVTFDKDNFVQESFTITSFKIQNVHANKLKSDFNNGDIIKVAEPVYVIDKGIKPGKTEFSINGYKLMKQNSKYILVLKPDVTYPDLFVISGINEGKYNIDRTDIQEKINVDDKIKIEKFKNNLLDQFNLK